MNFSNTGARCATGLTTLGVIAAAVATFTLTACGPRDAQSSGALIGQAPATAAPSVATQPVPPAIDAAPSAQIQPMSPVPVAPVTMAPTYRSPSDVPPVRTAQWQPGDAQPVPAGVPAGQHRIDMDRNSIGSVESIEPIRNRPQGSGAGAVIGGVLGAVVGNQFGHSAGRAAMTGLGAVGGAVAGNNIERNHREGVTGYRVGIRLDNGSTRTYERADVGNLQVGDRVHVDPSSFDRV